MNEFKRHGRRWLGILLSMALLVTMVVVASVTATGTGDVYTEDTVTGIAPVDIPLITFLAPETIWLQSATTPNGRTRTVDRVSNIVPVPSTGALPGVENYARLLFQAHNSLGELDSRVRLVQIENAGLPSPAPIPGTGFVGSPEFAYMPGWGAAPPGHNNHLISANLHDRVLPISEANAYAPMETRLVTWIATFTIDGFPGNFQAHAYSIVWAPSTYVAGSVASVGGAATLNTSVGVVGLHSGILNSASRHATTRFFTDLRDGTRPGGENNWQRYNYLTVTGWGYPSYSFGLSPSHVFDGNVVWGHGVRNVTNGVHVPFGFTNRIHFGNMVVDQRMEGYDIPGFRLTYTAAHRSAGAWYQNTLVLGQGNVRAGAAYAATRFPGAYGEIVGGATVNPNTGYPINNFPRNQFTTSRLWNNANAAGRPANGLWTHGDVVPFSVWHWVRAGSVGSESDANNAAIGHHVQFGVNWVDKTPLRNQVVAASTQHPARPPSGPYMNMHVSIPASVTAHRGALQAAVRELGHPRSTTTLAHPIPSIVPQGINATATVQYVVRTPQGALVPAPNTLVNFTDYRELGLGTHEARITVPAGVANNVTITPIDLSEYGYVLAGIVALGTGATAPAVPGDITDFSWTNTIHTDAIYILIFEPEDQLPYFTIYLMDEDEIVGYREYITVAMTDADDDRFVDLLDDTLLYIPDGQALTGWLLRGAAHGSTVFIPYDSNITVGQVIAMVGGGTGSTIIFEPHISDPDVTDAVIVVYRPNGATLDELIGTWPQRVVRSLGGDHPAATDSFDRMGYRFLGWTLDAGAIDEDDNELFEPGDDVPLALAENAAPVIDLFAQWEQLTFELTFGAPTVHTGAMGAAVAAVPAPTAPEGQHFVGWACASAPTIVLWYSDNVPTTMPDLRFVDGLAHAASPADGIDYTATLVAVFEANIYHQVTFNPNYTDATITTIPVLAGTSLGALFPAAPTRTGYYDFVGWFSAPTAGTQFIGNSLVTGNLTLYARWEAIVQLAEFTVTFNRNYTDAAVIAPATVTEGDTLDDVWPTVAPRDGYEFVGWFNAPSAGTQFIENSLVEGNLTLYARWVALDTGVQVTVTFNPNGGVLTNPADATRTLWINSELGATPAVTRADFDLAGWYTTPGTPAESAILAAAAGERFIANSLVTDNLTLYARWVTPHVCPTCPDCAPCEHYDTEYCVCGEQPTCNCDCDAVDGYCDCDGDLNECLRPSRPGYCDCDDDLNECLRPSRPGYCDCDGDLNECLRPSRPG
ncbi:MAG: InlB B-repeat-containing protein, partial [Oscillospiraceae bacterium]|nr:InlB B-repeat-containing protein [Oscillospiraceae bacterium]